MFWRRIVGWSMQADMTSQLVTDSLTMAVGILPHRFSRRCSDNCKDAVRIAELHAGRV